jgi:hypothetical protein
VRSDAKRVREISTGRSARVASFSWCALFETQPMPVSLNV